MTVGSPQAPLTDLFRDFYALGEEQRRRLGRDEGSEASIEGIQEPLMAFLEALDTEEDRSADALVRKEVKYALAAFADDWLTRLQWRRPGESRATTLESRLFQSDEGGSEIFLRIKKLLEVGDPGRRELARVYLLMLVLGFRGEFEEKSTERALAEYRRRLLAFAVPDREGKELHDWICPSAYQHTVGRAAPEPLPDLRAWAWAALGAVLLLFTGSFFLWHDATSTVTTVVERILGMSGAP